MMTDGRYPLTIPAWARIPCAECSNEYLATRGSPRVVKGPEDEICDDCKLYARVYEEGYNEGLKVGRKDVLTKLHPRLQGIAESMRHALAVAKKESTGG